MVRFNSFAASLLPGWVLLGAAHCQTSCVGVNAIAPSCKSNETLHYRDFFYVGGRYVDSAAGNLTYDQIYVEKLTPAAGVTQPKPIVFFHGGGTISASQKLPNLRCGSPANLKQALREW